MNGVAQDNTYSICGERLLSETVKSKYLIVMSAHFNEISIKKPNAALLITDTNEIKDIEKLLFNNPQPIQYKCGYHYELFFMQERNCIFENYPINVECDFFCFDNKEIHSKMKEYAYALEHNPTHYVYELEIDEEADVSNVLNILSEANLNTFIIQSIFTSKEKLFLLDNSDNVDETHFKLRSYSFLRGINEYCNR